MDDCHKLHPLLTDGHNAQEHPSLARSASARARANHEEEEKNTEEKAIAIAENKGRKEAITTPPQPNKPRAIVHIIPNKDIAGEGD